MRIAHVVAHRVTAPTSGYATRTWTISRALAQAGDLTIVHVGADPGDDDHRPEPVELDHGVVARYERVTTADLAARLAGHDLDVVVAGEPTLVPGIVGAPVARRIVDCQNVESDLWRAHATRGPARERAANEQRARASDLLERSVFPRLDQVWTVSGADADTLAARVPAPMIEVVPNVVAVPDDDPGPRASIPGHGVFFGSLWYPPNQDAATELLAVSEALTRREQPHRFTVAGAGAPEWLARELARASAVAAPGFVADLGTLLDGAACAVLPMTYGGGSMVKLLTALGAGCPVVTTPDGSRGIPELADGVHLVVRPLGEPFVDAVAAALAHPERFDGLGREGARLVRDRYSLDVLDARVWELLGSTTAVPGG